jgi:Zn-dependent M16 (insulinase) family peptidase
MGSEKYPYKGILDKLSNLAFSNGTNAWTDDDHTATPYRQLVVKDSFSFFPFMLIISYILQSQMRGMPFHSLQITLI